MKGVGDFESRILKSCGEFSCAREAFVKVGEVASSRGGIYVDKMLSVESSYLRGEEGHASARDVLK